MIRRIVFMWFLFVGICTLEAQVREDFSDPDLRDKPVWEGTLSRFKVANGRLQSDGIGTDSVWISTFCSDTGEIEFSCFLKIGFNPSSSNYVRWYLNADTSYLEMPLQGYYVQLGGSTGSSDSVSLYYQSGKQRRKIIAGRPSTVGKSSNEIAVRFRRDASGTLTLETDTGGHKAYQLEGIGKDTMAWKPGYMGLLMAHTSSNAAKLSWDNVYAGPWQVDTTAPDWVSAEMPHASRSRLCFSEELDTAGLELTAIQPAIPVHWNWDAAFPQQIWVDWPEPLIYLEEVKLLVTGLKDGLGNKRSAFEIRFPGKWTQYQDIVFTEILADPSPSYGLPEAEMLEIFNASQDTIQLKGWILKDGQGEVSLPAKLVFPGDYLILCGDKDTASWKIFGNTLGIYGFPSLTNSGEPLALYSPARIMTDTLGYTDKWYQDPVQRSGGVSLERLFIRDLCQGNGNWMASLLPSGGSPGSANSIYAGLADTLRPELAAVKVPDATTVVLEFNKVLRNSKLQTSVYLDGSWQPDVLIDIIGKEVRISNLPALISGKPCQLKLLGLQNCNADPLIIQVKIQWDKIYKAGPGDWAINEILFNPYTEGADFIELINISNHLLDLGELALSSADKPQLYNCAQSISPVLPGTYVVLTTDTNNVKANYRVPAGAFLAQMKGMPSLPDEKGGFCLKDTSGNVLTTFYYSEKWHLSLLDNPEGFSLERIALEREENDAENWQSASWNAGGATPGSRNSQSRIFYGNEEKLSVLPGVFSPDQDGHDDFALISYASLSPGWVGNMEILTPDGMPVRKLMENQVLGTEGTLKWDGTSTEGYLLASGVYVVVFEFFNPGAQKSYKEKVPVVLYR